MINYPEICKARVLTIFSTRAGLPMRTVKKNWSGRLDGCLILMANDYEIELITAKTDSNKAAYLNWLKAIIVTQGEFGSLVSTQTEECKSGGQTKQAVTDRLRRCLRGGLLSGLGATARASKTAPGLARLCLFLCKNATALRITGSVKRNSTKGSPEYSKIVRAFHCEEFCRVTQPTAIARNPSPEG